MKNCTCPPNAWEYYCPEHGGESRVFVEAFNSLAQYIHNWAKRKGFWDQDNNDAAMIALVHSELSEALEAIRNGNPPDDNIPEFREYEVELADAIIRIMDIANARGLKVAEAIIAKMAYNETRPRKHNKLF